MRKMIFVGLLVSLFTLYSCGELQSVVNSFPSSTETTSSNSIAGGLKEALVLGVSNGVDVLSAENGYFNDAAVKILLPEELQKIDKTLRKVGLSSLADQGLKVLNEAAEDAVTEAKPILFRQSKT